MTVLLNRTGRMYGYSAAAAPGFTDDFNGRSESLETSADWTKYFGTLNGTVGSDILTFSGSGAVSAGWFSSYSEAGDVYVEADWISDNALNDWDFSLNLTDAAGENGYTLNVRANSTNWTLRTRRIVSNVATTINDTNLGARVSGDTIRLERINFDASTVRLRVLLNGAQEYTYDDITANRFSGTATAGLWGYVPSTRVFAIDNYSSGLI